ncbi:MAG: large conductance mechanosensitive channel protein MscL [Kouleothrix sp.]|nr:large conductance mechanosensitive channel protein MscL [Kouleothrix sp.]
MFKGFRDFLLRGNVVDLAVAVIIGAAFGAVVNSLVKDVFTPIIGAIGGQPDFAAVTLGPIMIGNFLNSVIAFLIIAAAVYYVIILPINRITAMRAKQAPPAAPPAPTKEELLLTEIRDILRSQRS